LTPAPAYEAATVTLRAAGYLGSEPDRITRVALEPVRFLSSSRRCKVDYFSDDPADYVLESPGLIGPADYLL
jgi:hypothetical protein